jgi:excisionase family DNA binding protein
MTFGDIDMLNETGLDLQAFLTTEEVLGYLKTTPRTIYRLIRSGELPAVRIGRQWRFRRTDLDAWVERQRPFQMHAAN